ncbi:aminoglycoside phosphotransferase family protein [Pullulanibacillus sp. KACC 23026]|uniref:phosphotransferase family protein n=1 Tax=Pullulanibacillus sp. KACC 23026 TaxID=3028315 RepID=UPI0023AE6EBE|nr:aminoglycoside phosphotransferase family protein [Pullulanibacillus sp. KACC 23026]WEG12117.1 aminoglycoside phosphotransferase family protein [Pullulanibacillus sp. KACC 23026]
MKDNWERLNSPPSLNSAQINDIIEEAFPNKRVIYSERIGVGLSNSNYKIYFNNTPQPFVFRLYRGTKEVASKELEIAHLISRHIPIANFIVSDTSCSKVDHPWSILEWKDGQLLWNVIRQGTREDIASSAESTGKVLADIHRFTFNNSGFFGKSLKIKEPFRMDGDRFLSVIDECLHNNCGLYLGETYTRKVWSFCQTYSSLLTENQESPVLVHSDYNGLNLLVQQKGNGYSVSAVLDWEDAFSWNRYADIGNMLRYEEAASIFETHFIRGYQENGVTLNDNWKLLSKLEDLVALCDMLNHSTPNTPNRVNDLKNLILNTIQCQFK